LIKTGRFCAFAALIPALYESNHIGFFSLPAAIACCGGFCARTRLVVAKIIIKTTTYLFVAMSDLLPIFTFLEIGAVVFIVTFRARSLFHYYPLDGKLLVGHEFYMVVGPAVAGFAGNVLELRGQLLVDVSVGCHVADRVTFEALRIVLVSLPLEHFKSARVSRLRPDIMRHLMAFHAALGADVSVGILAPSGGNRRQAFFVVLEWVKIPFLELQLILFN
jgi:hypothetical protein